MATLPLRLIALFALLLAGCGAPNVHTSLATIDSRLAVVKVEAAAAHAGLRLGDVIYGVNERRIRSAVDFARLLAELPPGSPLSLLVRRGATDFYLAVDPGRRARQPTDTLLRT